MRRREVGSMLRQGAASGCPGGEGARCHWTQEDRQGRPTGGREAGGGQTPENLPVASGPNPKTSWEPRRV